MSACMTMGPRVARMMCLGLGLLLIVPTGHARGDSFFDVWTGLEATMGPPYPSAPPIHIEGFADDDPGAEIPIEVIDLELYSAPVDMTTGLTAGDSGGGGGGGGGAETTVTIDCTVIAGDPPVGGTTPIELMFEFTNPDGSPAQGTVVSSYIIDSFFDVWTELSLDDGGVMAHHLHGEIAPGQGAMFDEVDLPEGIFDSFFDVFVSVRADAPIVNGVPLMTLTLTGTYVPEPAGATVMMLAGLGLLRRGRR